MRRHKCKQLKYLFIRSDFKFDYPGIYSDNARIGRKFLENKRK